MPPRLGLGRRHVRETPDLPRSIPCKTCGKPINTVGLVPEGMLLERHRCKPERKGKRS